VEVEDAHEAGAICSRLVTTWSILCGEAAQITAGP
jgi:hypothetical protein